MIGSSQWLIGIFFYFFSELLDFRQMTEKDQELYQNFPLVISERWQAEVAETVFDTINAEADKTEAKRKTKHRKFDADEKGFFLSIFHSEFIIKTFV